MSAPLFAFALLALAPYRAPVTLNVNLTNGQSITGDQSIRVTVVANNPITQVEFYVGTDLRDNATSTPYMFKLDSLNEDDGDLKLRFKAYTTEGETGERTITVHIDNGVSLGADVHVKKGLDYLAASDFDHAVTEGRIGLKADGKSNAARIVLTRAYLGLKQYDKAQKYAEDAVAQDPKNTAALNLLAGVNIQQAFALVAKGGADKAETLATERDALKAAVTSRRTILDNAMDALPTPTDATLSQYADTAIAAERYSLAENELMKRYMNGNNTPAVIDRLAYVQMRQCRFADALTTLDRAGKLSTLDAPALAIRAVCYAETNDATDSDAALHKAQQLAPDNLTVRTAAAYIALKYARITVADRTTMELNYDNPQGKLADQRQNARLEAQKILTALQNDLGQRTETNYFVQSIDNKLDDYEGARKAFLAAILAEPANSDAYIEQGNRSIVLSFRGKLEKDEKDSLYEDGLTMYKTAIAASPSSPAALAGLCVVSTLQGKVGESLTWGEAAVAANKDYAAGYIAVGTAYTIASKAYRLQADAIRKKNGDISLSPADRQNNELQARDLEAKANKYSHSATEAGNAAARLDPRISGYDLTNAQAAAQYFSVGGRLPVIAPPTP
jgi:hypothetical protein